MAELSAARRISTGREPEPAAYALTGAATLGELDPVVAQALTDEMRRQEETIELIASENCVSAAVLEAQGSVLTNKYAEGYPGHRYYGGCRYVDVVESLAIERAKTLLGSEHANVQPHSGSQANAAAYRALLELGDPVLAMSLAHGGHLTHGHKLNFSGREYRFAHYGVRREDERIDYDALEAQALELRPRPWLWARRCGPSSCATSSASSRTPKLWLTNSRNKGCGSSREELTII